MPKTIFALLLLITTALSVSAQEAKPDESLALKYLVQQPQQKTKHMPVVILLHGYGSDEKDLFELRSKFPKKYLVVSARAPYPAPNGGYQWYAFTSGNGQNHPQKGQVGSSRRLIQQFVTEITGKYKADARQVYLVGFSQGAIMCYEAGLTAPDKVKGIAVLSGRIDQSVRRGMSRMDEVKKLKIFVAHGTADERIKFEEGKAAADVLTGWGLSPEFHEYTGMGHSIGTEELSDLVKWLK